MSIAKAQQPRGIQVGGQFATASHGEAGVILSGGPPPVPELERYQLDAPPAK